MSDIATELTPATEQAPPPEAPVEQQEQPVIEQQAAPPDDDPLEPELQAQVIDIPDGDKLVPLSALTAVRKQLKALKPQAAKAGDLEQQIAQLQGQVSAQNPILQAAQALLVAQQQAPKPEPQQPGLSREELQRLESFARNYDLYTADGKPDLERAYRIKQDQRADTEDIARQVVAPIVQRTLSQEVDYMVQRAEATDINGVKPDPGILKASIDKIKAQPGGLQMLASAEYMKEVWQHALGASIAAGKVKLAAAAAPAQAQPRTEEVIPPPIFTEKSGGAMPAQKALSPMEAKAAKELGMSHADYLKIAATKPW